MSNLSNNPNKIDPPFLLQPQEFDIKGKSVIYLFVPSSSQVHKSCGKVYDRSSDGDFVLKSHSKISELYLKKNNFYSENVIYPYLYEEHFKPDLLNKVRNLINSFHPGHPWLDLSDSDFYKAAGLYRYDTQNHVEGFTLAALLLFGKDEIIHSTLPYYRIEAIVRKENLERYDDRITVMCNLIDAHEQLMEFIRKHLPDTFYMEKDQRISIREKLFREIVANLLIHREYLNPSVSMITIEKDNVLAINANKPLHYENFEAYKFQSFPKNPTIALFFVQIGRAEFLGTGIRNIVKYSKAYAHSTPIFEDDNMFEVKIPLKQNQELSYETNGPKDINLPENLPVNLPVNLPENLPVKSELDNAILQILAVNPKTTYTELSIQLNVTKETIRVHIKKLQENGLITRMGSNKNGYWAIAKDNKNLPENLPINLPINLPENLPENLPVKSELDNAILQILAVNPKTTYTELSIQLNVTKETIRVHIKKLQENGLITRMGSNKNGYWAIKTDKQQG